MKSKVERVDDIPLLVAGFEKSELSDLVNHYFPDHGNWQGTDGGKVTIGFLTYILSCSDHRISYVEDWAKDRIITLRHCLGDNDLRSKDFTDDKLTNLLERFSDEERWSKFEHAHNQRLINCLSVGIRRRTYSFRCNDYSVPSKYFRGWSRFSIWSF